MQRQAYSSLNQSVAVNLPMYPPPVVPQSVMIRGGYAGFRRVPDGHTPYSSGSPIVSRKPRQGIRHLYSYGGRVKKWFRMKSVGQVEATAFQPINVVLVDADFNDRLYEAGFPRNLGVSEKVPTTPKELRDGSIDAGMRPSYMQTRSIFTRRSYSTVKAVPAEPQQK